jgi:hypothetical protein
MTMFLLVHRERDSFSKRRGCSEIDDFAILSLAFSSFATLAEISAAVLAQILAQFAA